MKRLSALLLLSALAFPAFAADLPTRPVGKAPDPVVKSQPTSYLYWGVGAGGVWGDTSGTAGGTTITADPQGYLLSLILGLDMWSGRHLFRIEGNIGLADAKDSALFGIAKSEISGLSRLIAAYGYDLGGVTPFITVGGYAARHEIALIGINDTKTHMGLTWGAGVEVPLPSNWKLRGEWYRLEKDTANYSIAGGNITGKVAADIGMLALTRPF